MMHSVMLFAALFFSNLTPESALTPAQMVGCDLFAEHRMVCHVRTQITLSGHFGSTTDEQASPSGSRPSNDPRSGEATPRGGESHEA